MRTFRAQGLVLKAFDQGEYNRLYLIYTNNQGKLLASVFGARRSQNLISGHLQPFLLNELLIDERHNFFHIAEATTSKKYSTFAHQTVAKLHVVAELVDGYTELYQPDDKLFVALTYASQLITSPRQHPLTFIEVLAKVLAALGVAPSTSSCVISGREVKESDQLYWSSLHGGVVVAINQLTPDDHYTLRPLLFNNSLKLIKLLSAEEPLAHRLRAKPAIREESEQLLLHYVQTQVQTQLRALPFLHTNTKR